MRAVPLSAQKYLTLKEDKALVHWPPLYQAQHTFPEGQKNLESAVSFSKNADSFTLPTRLNRGRS